MENVMNNLRRRVRKLEKIAERNNGSFSAEAETNRNLSLDSKIEEEGEKEYEGNLSVNMMGFQNVQTSQSKVLSIPEEKLTNVTWTKYTSKGGAFGGVKGNTFIVNTNGKNVLYEFIITASWEANEQGSRTICLEDPAGNIVSSTFIPDKVPEDNEKMHRHQVVFKQYALSKGGWKVKLYQNSGQELNVSVKFVVVGPFIL